MYVRIQVRRTCAKSGERRSTSTSCTHRCQHCRRSPPRSTAQQIQQMQQEQQEQQEHERAVLFDASCVPVASAEYFSRKSAGDANARLHLLSLSEAGVAKNEVGRARPPARLPPGTVPDGPVARAVRTRTGSWHQRKHCSRTSRMRDNNNIINHIINTICKGTEARRWRRWRRWSKRWRRCC